MMLVTSVPHFLFLSDRRTSSIRLLDLHLLQKLSTSGGNTSARRSEDPQGTNNRWRRSPNSSTVRFKLGPLGPEDDPSSSGNTCRTPTTLCSLPQSHLRDFRCLLVGFSIRESRFGGERLQKNRADYGLQIFSADGSSSCNV